jgi:hypothetical protein
MERPQMRLAIGRPQQCRPSQARTANPTHSSTRGATGAIDMSRCPITPAGIAAPGLLGPLLAASRSARIAARTCCCELALRAGDGLFQPHDRLTRLTQALGADLAVGDVLFEQLVGLSGSVFCLGVHRDVQAGVYCGTRGG